MIYYAKEEVGCMKPLKEKVSLTLDSDILEQIKILAEDDDRSVSQFVNKVLKEYLKEKQAENLFFCFAEIQAVFLCK